jgi:hypothetical protein
MTTDATNSDMPLEEEFSLLANSLVKSGLSQEKVLYFLNKYAEIYEKDVPDNQLTSIIEFAHERASKPNRGIMAEVRDFVGATEGHFLATDCYNLPQIATNRDKKTVRTCLSRLCDAGEIERYGNRAGQYRRIEKEIDDIDWWSEKGQPLVDFRLPFGLSQEWVNVMPRTISVIAGAPDSGKTALLLNIAIDNCEKYPVQYFSSEMDEVELGERLQLHEEFSMSRFRNIKFKSRSRNFKDVIDPDGVNIIDFFEITDVFYMIAKEFTDMRDKLNNGVVITGLQKTAGADTGRGGDFSLEKPRLYLNLDRDYPEGNKLTIRKAKNWKDPARNPNYFVQNFLIVKGINLVPIGVWKPEEE